MPNILRSRIAKTGYVALFLCLCSSSALADMAFNIQGSSAGQFYLGSTPLGSSITGLAFNGASFGPTATTQVTLGAFNLNTLLAYFDPLDFRLSINFVGPTTNGTTFSANLSGLVSLFGGTATINFDNTPKHFTFSNAQGSGSFDLTLSDVRVSNGSTGSIIGKISNATFATTPEPTAVVLTSAFLGGLLILFRKRIRSC
jgi:hypothetical protein